ncbi:MAG: hypothetical protein V4726_04140 [Verrucomicrobiota bacterium]
MNPNPIIREFQRLERRGERVLKVAPFIPVSASPHVEIHVGDGGPPYPVSVGGFTQRDHLLAEFAAYLGHRGQCVDGRTVLLTGAPAEVAA